MATYVIVNLQVHDPATYERYRAAAPALIKRHGGEYLVRGGDCELLEGTWHPQRLVVLRFPGRQAALAFFNDPDYQPLKEMRQRSTSTDAVMVEGV
jgi:uncharacterized protein (DUF1330 family)